MARSTSPLSREGFEVVLLSGFGVLVAVVYGALTLITAFGTGTFRIELPLSNAAATVPVGSDRIATAVDVTHAMVTVPATETVAPAMFVASVLTKAAIFVAVAVLIGLVAQTFRRREPFAERNARRLHIASGLLILAGVISQFVDGWTQDRVIEALGAGVLDARYEQLSGWLVYYVGGILLALIANAFRRGAALQKDTEGLV